VVGNDCGLIVILSRHTPGKTNKSTAIRKTGMNMIHFPYTWLDNDPRS